MMEELVEDGLEAANDTGICWLDEWHEIGTEEKNLDVLDLVFTPFVPAKVVNEQEDLLLHLLHSFIKFLQCI